MKQPIDKSDNTCIDYDNLGILGGNLGVHNSYFNSYLEYMQVLYVIFCIAHSFEQLAHLNES